MLIEHFIIANGSSIDHERHSLSVFEMLEDLQIQTNALPISVSIQIVIVLKREVTESGEHRQNFTLEIVGPDGSKTFQQEFPAVMQAAHRRARLRVNMPLVIARSGVYRFVLQPTGNEDAGRDLDIIVQANLVQNSGPVN